MLLRLSLSLAISGLLPNTPAWAETKQERPTVVSVRAGQTCLKEEVRIAGFVVPREEKGANIDMPGYRVNEILVAEGDRVSANQEIVRAVRIGDDEPPQGGAGTARASLPASISLRSPISGTITRINIKVGAITGAPMAPARPGMPPEPQVRIAAQSGVDLLVDVPSLYATQMRKGLAARVVVADGRQVAGTVRVPVSEIDPGTQLGQARIAIQSANAPWPGQFASAVIETARGCAVAVPRSAVTYQNGNASVQVVNGSSVETRSIRTGLSDGSRVQITEGLAEGEPVVSSAGTALKAGEQVNPVLQGETGGGTP